MESKPKVYIVIYTLYHHMYKLAAKVAEGVEANGCQVKVFQVEETLSTEILDKMHAPPKPDLPIISAAQLAEADGIIFGLPTRFGSCPAQMKRLLDATGSLWAKGTLSQKFAGFFFSTASSHGGQETTALTAVTYLVHHGINYVPFGFANASLFDNSKVIGGSPYGAGTISNGDGTRIPIQEELDMAKNQGENFAKLLAIYHRGLRKSVAGIEKKQIHANNSTPTEPATTTSTSTAKAPEVEVGAAAGAVAAAAGGAGLVAAGTKAAQESDQAVKQGPPTQATGGGDTTGAKQGAPAQTTGGGGATAAPSATTQGDQAAKKSGPTATQGELTGKQGGSIEGDQAPKQAAPPPPKTATSTTTTSNPTVQQGAPTQNTPATKQDAATQNQQAAKGAPPTTTTAAPDSSTQPPNRPLNPQQQQAQAATQPPPQEAPAAAAHKEKKKSKSFWFCCGNSNDLD